MLNNEQQHRLAVQEADEGLFRSRHLRLCTMTLKDVCCCQVALRPLDTFVSNA